jgi:hypothetical protein
MGMKKTVIMTAVCLMMAGAILGTSNVTITFKGAAVEDAQLQSNGALNNYGAVIQGGATRTVLSISPAYSNRSIGVFRAVGLGDSLTAHAATPDSGAIDLRIYSIAWNDTTGLAGWYVLRPTAIRETKDWIHGNKSGTAAACECCYDSAVAIGVGACTGIDWTGCTAAADTVGFRTGLADSALITRDTLAGHTVRLKFYGADIVAMQIAGANNGWAVLTSSKAGNISVTTKFYGSECTMTGYADSISVITIWATSAGAPAPPFRQRRICSAIPDGRLRPHAYNDRYCRQIDWGPLDWGADR